MSFGGMLATAFAGGAQQVGQIAANDVQNQQKLDLAKEQAAVEEAMRMRLAEFGSNLDIKKADALRSNEFAFSNDPTNVAARQATATSDTMAKGAAERSNQKAGLSDAELNDLQRKKAADDAAAAGAARRAGVVADAVDTGYLAAMKTVALADPAVAAHIAQMRAAVNASNASAGEAGARTGLIKKQGEALDLSIKDQKDLSAVYDDQQKVLSDPSLSGPDRAQKLNELEKRATLIQGRSGKNAGTRDPELNTATTETTKVLPDGTQVKTTEKSVRRPGEQTGKPTEDDAQAQARDAVAKGASVDAVNARLKAAGFGPLADNAKVVPASSGLLKSVQPAAPRYEIGPDGRTSDVTTGRTLTPEQVAILAKIKNGEPTSPRERALLKE